VIDEEPDLFDGGSVLDAVRALNETKEIGGRVRAVEDDAGGGVRAETRNLDRAERRAIPGERGSGQDARRGVELREEGARRKSGYGCRAIAVLTNSRSRLLARDAGGDGLGRFRGFRGFRGFRDFRGFRGFSTSARGHDRSFLERLALVNRQF